MFKKIYNKLSLIFIFNQFIIDLLIFKLFKNNISDNSFKFFHLMFFKSKGLSNKILHQILRSNKIKFFFKENDTIFKTLNFDDLDCKKLKKNGYSYHKNIVSKKITEKIIESSEGLNGIYSSDEYNSEKKEKLNQENLKAKKFAISSNDLINIPEIQDIVINQKILEIAQDYLESAPILDIISVSFSFPNKKNDSNAAQMWHIDLDRPKWIKFFIFLNDCTSNNGPHKFIESSHLTSNLPKEILKKGYKRIEDNLISNHFNEDKITSFVGNAGSVLIEDSVGLHRGSQVLSGRRVMMQVQFSSSLFGAKKEAIIFPNQMTKNFKEAVKNYPRIFENFCK